MEEFSRDETYRIFVTRSLQLAPQNKYIDKNYIDFVNNKVEEEKSGDEIAMEIFTKGGLKFE